MFSVSSAELMTIAVIALIVFGPKRLPEIAKKAGKVIKDLRASAEAFKTDLEGEYGEVVEPLNEARREMRSAIGDIETATRPDPVAHPGAPRTDSGSDPAAATGAPDPEVEDDAPPGAPDDGSDA